MFKKRQNVSRKIDLNSQIQQIKGTYIASNTNQISIEPYVEVTTNQINTLFKDYKIIQQKQQLEEIFEEIRCNKQIQIKQQRLKHQEEDELEQNNKNVISINNTNKKVIIVDDSDGLQVVEDHGQLISDEEGNYEDELIKKTLTKHNYQRLKNDEYNNSKLQTNRDKIRRSIAQVSEQKTKAQIQKDLNRKKTQLLELKSEIQYLNLRTQSKNNELKKKKQSLSQINQKLQKVKKIMEFIYYYGDKIIKFDNGSILKQIEDINNVMPVIQSDYSQQFR